MSGRSGWVFSMRAAVIVVSTGMAVTRKNQVHAVVYLINSFLGTAVLFYLLGAPLLAALEVIIYAGAIMVLFLFIIMTMGPGVSEPLRLRVRQWVFPSVLGFFCVGAAGLLVFRVRESGDGMPVAMASPAVFGRFVFERYWFAVEIVSLLLFVALVGALYLGKKEDSAAVEIQKDKP